MTSKTRTQTTAEPAGRTATTHQAITLGLASAFCAHSALADNLSSTVSRASAEA